MTTDAFSTNFSFADDEKNASNSLNVVPDSKNETPTNEAQNGDAVPDSSVKNEEASSAAEFDPFASFDLPETPEGSEDAADPFAAFSFGFNQQEDEFADLPAEMGTEAEVTPASGEEFPEFSLDEGKGEPLFFPDPEVAQAETPISGNDSLEIGDFSDEFSLDAPTFMESESGTAPTEIEVPESEPVSFFAPDEVSTFVEPEVIEEIVPNVAEYEEDVEPIVLVTPVKVMGQSQYDEAFAPFLKDPPHVATVAILGASGIGSNHARWFVKHGCQVVSFLGSSEESNVATQEKLKREIEFEGQGYTNLQQLLEETKPEIVCVATPSEFHFMHALEALEAGAHVLCEKPLTYAPARKIRENIAGATELIKTAKKKNLLLGTQLQYGAATPILTKMAGVAPEEVGDFAMEIETTNRSAPRDPRELWTDLGPHALSIAAFLGGEGAKLIDDSIQFFPRTEGQMVEASARFSIRRADERLLTVRAITRFAPKDSMWRAPHRRFSFNGRVVNYRGYQTPSGEYAAQFTAPDGYDSHYPDPVDFLIGNFVRATRSEEDLLIDGEFGKQNLEWLLKINAE